MTRFALAIVFATAFALFAVGTIPLGLVLSLTHAERTGLAARDVSGSIWSGTLKDMRLRGVRLGDTDVGFEPFALAAGMRRLHLRSERGEATIVGGRMQGMDHAGMTVGLGELGLGELGLALPFEGVVRLQDVSLLYESGSCSQAAGHIATDLLRLTGNGPELAGELACDGDSAVARLSGKAGEVGIGMTVRIDAGGHYRSELRAGGADPALSGALLLAGFVQSGDALVRIDEGMLGT